MTQDKEIIKIFKKKVPEQNTKEIQQNFENPPVLRKYPSFYQEAVLWKAHKYVFEGSGIDLPGRNRIS